jgi:hypothetical protein
MLTVINPLGAGVSRIVQPLLHHQSGPAACFDGEKGFALGRMVARSVGKFSIFINQAR